MADNEIKLEEQVLDGEQVGPISADITLDKMVGSIAMQDQFLSGAGEEIVIEVREDIEVTGVSDLLELKADFDNITDNIKSSIIEAQNTVSDANATLKNIIAYLDDIEDMKDQVAEDRSQVSKMKSDVEDMQTRVTDLSSSVYQAKNYVDNEVANFDTKLAEANKLDSSIKDQVSEANRVLRSISNRSTEFDTKLSTAKGYLDSVTNLKGSVENLAKQVSSDKEDVSNNQSIVDRLTKEVRTTKVAIDSIESSLNTKHSEVLRKADEVEADRAQVASRATQVSSDASEVSTWHSETKTFRDDAQESKSKAFQWRSDAETFRDLAETASDNASDSETKAENYKDAAETAQADVSTKHSDVVNKHTDVVNKANQVASNTAKVASNKAATDNNAAAAQQSEDEAENWADEAKAWAISKPNNSAKYWAEEAEKALNKAYVSGGTWNPKKQGEYPSTTNISGDTRWTVVLGGRNETYRYTSGDLDDTTVRSGDELFYDISESKWSVIQVPLTSGVESIISPASGEEQGRVTITAAKLNSLTKTESDNRYLAKRAKAESAKVADAANKLSAPITVSITGDATGQVSALDGSRDVSIPITIDSYKKSEADGKFANKTEVVPKSGGEFTGNVRSTKVVSAPILRTAADGSWGLSIGTDPKYPGISPVGPTGDAKFDKQLRFNNGKWQANDRDIFTKEFPPNPSEVGALPVNAKAKSSEDSDKLGGVSPSSFLRSDQDDTMSGVLKLSGVGKVMEIGDLNSDNAHIRFGNSSFGWRVEYNGSTSGQQGNEFQIMSDNFDSGIRIGHEGSLEVLRHGISGWSNVALEDRPNVFTPVQFFDNEVRVGRLDTDKFNHRLESKDSGATYRTDNPNRWRMYGPNGTFLQANHNNKTLDSVNYDLHEKGKRVYSPNNKPTAADVDALPANGKAVDASKLNGRADHYHPDNKPSAAELGVLSANGKAKNSAKSDYATRSGELRVHDTRNDEVPTDYGSGKMVWAEFKRAKSIGLSGNYCGSIVFQPWGDPTGNGTYNLLFQDGNMYYRHATIGAESWSKPYAFYHEGNKPSASDVGARPSNWTPRWQDIRLKPATFDSEWSKISGKPSSYPSSWNDVANKPRFATRWPTINEVLSRNDVSDSKLSFRMKGCALDIGGGTQTYNEDTYIRMGDKTYAWKINYHGTSSGASGNELQVISTKTGKGYQIDHQGNFELEKGNGWEQVATVNSDITGNAKTATTATTATTASNAKKLNGRSDYYHPNNKPSASDVRAVPVETSGGHKVARLHTAINKNTSVELMEEDKHGLIVGYNGDDNYGYIVGRDNYTDREIVTFPRRGEFVDVKTNLRENGQRVYSPNNKPTAADVGAEPALRPEQTRSIFTGTGSPSNALGEDGDLYIED